MLPSGGKVDLVVSRGRRSVVRKLLALASLLVLAGSLGVAAISASSAPSFAAREELHNRTSALYSVAIGDLNGDGKPDLATANGTTNTVSVLLNRGDGSFRAKLDYSTGHGPGSVAIGDLNGDGKPDLATANDDANTVSVLLNRGDGAFGQASTTPTGRRPRLGRDRRPERRRQAGPGDRERRKRTRSPCSSTRATAASRPSATTRPARDP